MSLIKGIYAASLSVLNEDLTLNIKKTIEHAEMVIDQGCHGAAIFGSTGQAQLISVAEKIKLFNQLSLSKYNEKFIIGTGLNSLGETINLKSFEKSLIIINFWATWCAPCIEEMPSLNRLKTNPIFNNLKIIPINVGRDNIEKTKDFYKKLKIKDLKIYFDKDVELAKKFLLRGLPTTVFVNKKGEEFARVIGFVNFDDKNIIKWLKKYD